MYKDCKLHNYTIFFLDRLNYEVEDITRKRINYKYKPKRLNASVMIKNLHLFSSLQYKNAILLLTIVSFPDFPWPK